ncbi:MAG: UDP-N-acetylmuramoyl-L-alanyl-D-glutamate--2,6-diaminopimelate ligase [Actinomycetota bacterium]|nr:UDP-N-acetylmuramoyl-L-alanyl-D-glutamate--2,6-diaminopimelate ligase [Actinomycetota bacterium]
MTLKEASVLMGARLSGPADATFEDIVYDTRHVSEGALFFCIMGRHFDGHELAQEAVGRGARGLVVSRLLDIGVPQLLVDDSRVAMERFAAKFFDEPSAKMKMFGVTGTNGKTTTAFMADSIFRATGEPSGLLGTVVTRVADEEWESTRTTPETIDLQRTLAAMVDAKVTHVAMEVSSEGIAQGRLRGTRFELMAFTNLSQDHLDFHGDMESYFAAKALAFAPSMTSAAVVNIDDAWGRRLVEEIEVGVTTVSTAGPADFVAREVKMWSHGSSFRVTGDGMDLGLRLGIPGHFNISNALVAAVSAHRMGIQSGDIRTGLASLDGVPGRFEPVVAGQPFSVVVDYAHTPDSLINVLRAARQQVDGRVIVVIGCGGDRDKTKRPLMGKAAVDNADLAIITSDNPRSEEPASIIEQIEAGLVGAKKGSFRSIVDRDEAIHEAIAEAQDQDIVVIAGKGHETGQEFSDRKIPFDDRKVAARAIRERFGR